MEIRTSSLPRGIRNNNPANILRSGQRWLGLSKLQIDSRFCHFENMDYGLRAFFVLARTYRKKYGIKTVRSFIERFAPAKENDVDSYVSYIISHHNFSNGLNSNYDYVRLLYWIIRYENNLSAVDMKDLGLTHYRLAHVRSNFNIEIF